MTRRLAFVGVLAVALVLAVMVAGTSRQASTAVPPMLQNFDTEVSQCLRAPGGGALEPFPGVVGGISCAAGEIKALAAPTDQTLNVAQGIGNRQGLPFYYAGPGWVNAGDAAIGASCVDHIDNDRDGDIDAADPECPAPGEGGTITGDVFADVDLFCDGVRDRLGSSSYVATPGDTAEDFLEQTVAWGPGTGLGADRLAIVDGGVDADEDGDADGADDRAGVLIEDTGGPPIHTADIVDGAVENIDGGGAGANNLANAVLDINNVATTVQIIAGGIDIDGGGVGGSDDAANVWLPLAAGGEDESYLSALVPGPTAMTPLFRQRADLESLWADVYGVNPFPFTGPAANSITGTALNSITLSVVWAQPAWGAVAATTAANVLLGGNPASPGPPLQCTETPRDSQSHTFGNVLSNPPVVAHPGIYARWATELSDPDHYTATRHIHISTNCKAIGGAFVDADFDCLLDVGGGPGMPDEASVTGTFGCADTGFDRDLDGLPDGIEAAWGSNPCAQDTDLDGRSDLEEMIGPSQFLTDPNVADTDGDTVPDGGYKVDGPDAGMAPDIPDLDGDGAPDAGMTGNLDIAGDGSSHVRMAYQIVGFDIAADGAGNDNCPSVANPGQVNTDLDAATQLGGGDLQGDLCDTDDDQDGMVDGAEVTNGWTGTACNNDGSAPTNPLDADTDGDGVVDGRECEEGPSDPTDATSIPGPCAKDSDGDILCGVIPALASLALTDEEANFRTTGVFGPAGSGEVACADADDNDDDGLVNDGCPAVGPAEGGGECKDAVDGADGDGNINDGCPAAANVDAGDADGAGGYDQDNDTDGDGLADGCEVFFGATLPINPDSDEDGIPDGADLPAATALAVGNNACIPTPAADQADIIAGDVDVNEDTVIDALDTLSGVALALAGAPYGRNVDIIAGKVDVNVSGSITAADDLANVVLDRAGLGPEQVDIIDGQVDVDESGGVDGTDNLTDALLLDPGGGLGEIGNGIGVAATDVTDPAYNGGRFGGGIDVTYDDSGDGTWLGAGDDGPWWDLNADHIRDGSEAACAAAPAPPADADTDGLMDKWEVCKWGTDETAVDTDGDGIGDCQEAGDANGDGTTNFVGDVITYAKAALLPPANFGQDGDFDINGDGTVNFVGDVIQEAKYGLIPGLCQ